MNGKKPQRPTRRPEVALALVSDNAYAQQLREPRVIKPPYSAHNFARYKRMEAEARAAALTSGFAERTQAGASAEDRFDRFRTLRALPRQPEFSSGVITNTRA